MYIAPIMRRMGRLNGELRFRAVQPDDNELTPEEAETVIAALMPGEAPKRVGSGYNCEIRISNAGLDAIQGEVSRGKDGLLRYKVVSNYVKSWIGKTQLKPGVTYYLFPRQVLTLGPQGLQLDIKDEVAQQRLRQFIDNGLNLLKSGRYADANAYFHGAGAKAMAKFLRISYVPDTAVLQIQPMQNKADVVSAVELVEQNTYFNPQMRRLKIIDLVINEQKKLKPEQKALHEEAYHEAALVAADHWVRVLQYVSGKPLVSSYPMAIDAAFYLFQQEVPFTDRFLTRPDLRRFKRYLSGKAS